MFSEHAIWIIVLILVVALSGAMFAVAVYRRSTTTDDGQPATKSKWWNCADDVNATWIAIGLAIGVSIGAATGNIAMGIAIGAAIGIAVGSSQRATR